MTNRRLGFSVLLCAMFALTLSASASNQVGEIRAAAGQNINQGLPVELNIVFVYDAGIRSSLPNDAADWFSHRSQYQQNFAQAIDVLSLELVPGSSFEVKQGIGHFPERSWQAQEIWLYTYYQDPRGRRPQLVPNLTCVAISLGAAEATVGSC